MKTILSALLLLSLTGCGIIEPRCWSCRVIVYNGARTISDKRIDVCGKREMEEFKAKTTISGTVGSRCYCTSK